MDTDAAVEKVYSEHASRILAALVRLFGTRNLELAEDVLQEATIKKRLLRARERLQGHAFEFPPPDRLPHAMDTVHTVIYLLFNEGFHSSDEAAPMRLELCLEAVHLATQLVDEPRIFNQDT